MDGNAEFEDKEKRDLLEVPYVFEGRLFPVEGSGE
jgi:hypothetical protein